MTQITRPHRHPARRSMRFALVLGLAAVAAAATAQEAEATAPTPPVPALTEPAAPAGPAWILAAPSAERVDFRGLASFDGAGVDTKAALFVGAGHPVFAAVTALSFAINAVAIDHAREAQKTSVQLEADKILLPYETILAAYRSSDLHAEAVRQAKAVPLKTPNTRAWQVAARPVFSMTQDQRAIVLDTVVEVRAPDSTTPAFASAIRVVGAPHDRADLSAFWSAEQGRALRGDSEALFAEALRLAVQSANANANEVSALGAKSLRFMQGGIERVERGELLAQDCSRTVFRSLRGALMSVPTLRPDAACGQPPPAAVAQSN